MHYAPCGQKPSILKKLQKVIFHKVCPSWNKFFFFSNRYIFLEYNNHLNALTAVKSTNNYKIDKSHTFKVNLFTDFKKFEDIPENWEPPKAQPFKAANDLHYHLLEPDAYDQFCVLCGNGAGVSVQIWQNSAPEPTLLEERNVSSLISGK